MQEIKYISLLVVVFHAYGVEKQQCVYGEGQC